MSYKELRTIYANNFSLGYLNTDIRNKFALISLICYTVQELKKKKPDITYYQIVYKLCNSLGLPEEFINSLSIICEDFAYGCTEFPTFELEGKQIIAKIKEILNSYVPF